MPEEYVVVYTANGQLEGQMIRAFLESHGIKVLASVGMTYGLTITPLGQVTSAFPRRRLKKHSKSWRTCRQASTNCPRTQNPHPKGQTTRKCLRSNPRQIASVSASMRAW